ncbi:MAG: endolytic transglycosylase MltG [Candidatus Nitrospinota bacterium M3_3B_026]
MRKTAAVSGLAVVLALAGWGIVEMELARPRGGTGDAVVWIPKGASVRAAASKLAEEGVISSPLLFELEARLRAGGRIMAGEYLFERNNSIKDVVGKLSRGEALLHAVTIPEGYDIAGAARAMEKLLDPEDFMKAARDPDVLRGWGIRGESAEGYLFPETYHFRKGVTPRRAVETMVGMFFRKAREAIPEDVLEDPEKLHELVTLASIVEKETAAPDERALVAAVFKNRLQRGMPLQSDPTVIYALPDFDGNLTKEDLYHDSPYNTYARKGLPPGPIASPGLRALKAAARPADVDYLYFVSTNDGGHVFSATLAEHNHAVRRYQQNRGAAP